MINTLEVIINGDQKLDVNGDTIVALNYLISDIREYDKRRGSFTKPFTVPGSNNNNNLFGNIYDIQMDSQFNPNLKSDLLIKANGDVIFEGYLQLNKINKNFSDKVVSYDCSGYSNFVSLFDTMSDREISDIDFSEYNHIYSYDTVVGSWDTFIYENGSKFPFKKGNGYVYPYVDHGIGKSSFDLQPSVTTEFFVPYFYDWTIWNKIFQYNNFTYTSDFIDGPFFKSIVASPNMESMRISASAANDKLFNIGASNSSALRFYYGDFQNGVGSWSFPPDVLIGFTNSTTNNHFDNGNNVIDDFDPNIPPAGAYWPLGISPHTGTTYSRFISPNKAKYDFHCSLNIGYSIGFALADYFGIGTNIHKGNILTRAYLMLKRANGNAVILNQDEFDLKLSVSQSINYGPRYDVAISLDAYDVQMYAGDSIFVRMVPFPKMISTDVLGGTRETGILLFIDQQSELSNILLDETIQEGDPVPMQKLVPKMTQREFILSIMRQYNLFVRIDPDRPNNLLIEPRNSFYDSDKIIDWSQKWDRNTQHFFTPIPLVNSNGLILKYSEDGDDQNTKYQDNNIGNKTYGEKNVSNQNDFVVSKNITELSFAPTPLVKEFNSDRIISKITKTEGGGGEDLFDSAKTRQLFYAGLLQTDQYYIYQNDTAHTHNSYAYAGHFDDPENPSVDLNFWYPDFYLFDRRVVSENNIYNLYWRDYIENIFDKGSKLFTLYLDLKPYDIMNLDFSAYYYLDGTYWIINRIIDYDPLNPNLTKVELLRLINQNPTNQTDVVNGKFVALPAYGTGGNPNPPVGHPDAPGFGGGLTAYIPTGNINPGLFGPGKGTVLLLDGIRNTNNIYGINNVFNTGNLFNGIYGNDNNFGAQFKYNNFAGNKNSIGNVQYSFIRGSNNQISGEGRSSILFLDDYNYQTHGELAATYSLVYGASGSVNKIRFDDILSNINNSINTFNLVEAGVDDIDDPFAQNVINFISAGVDTIRDKGSLSSINFIDAGKDVVL